LKVFPDARDRGRILWWGHFDPDYSRNRILRQVLAELGWDIRDFRPRLSPFGDLEANLVGVESPDLVWVPCFRQRDIGAARRWSGRRGVPLLADPLISAYDKQVFERAKFSAESVRGRRLLKRERDRLRAADCVLADTFAHAEFFRETLGVKDEKIFVVPVGAEEGHFQALPARARDANEPLQVLFYGSFIPLQGPRVIVEAARRYRGPPVSWHLVGDGPLLEECRRLAADLPHVHFEPWVPYRELPARIGRADILLGIFGITPKARRVIPNKVYQAAACGRPVVTMESPAYPEALHEGKNTGFSWVPPGDAESLAAAVARLAGQPGELAAWGGRARASYLEFLSVAHIRRRLAAALEFLGLAKATNN